GMREAMVRILDMTDLFLPSGDELFLLTEARTAAEAVDELLGIGVTSVVHKLGGRGVRFHDTSTSRFVPAFEVTEVDPTGAGDCFGAAFISLWLRGGDIDEVLTLASAAGALAVTRRGPMEGVCDLETIRCFAASRPRVSE